MRHGSDEVSAGRVRRERGAGGSDEPSDALVGRAVQRFAEGKVGTTRHDKQHGIVEERGIVLDVVGHDRPDLVRGGRKLLCDRPHQA
jgi:hypothetical protein